MLPKDLLVRGYIKKEGDLWVAVCIDLCLAAQGETPDVAKRKMEAQIVDYLEEVFSEPEFSVDLLKRKAPASQIATYHLAKAIHRIHRCKDAIAEVFVKPLPMVISKAA